MVRLNLVAESFSDDVGMEKVSRGIVSSSFRLDTRNKNEVGDREI
jgi:hypothetical protein